MDAKPLGTLLKASALLIVVIFGLAISFYEPEAPRTAAAVTGLRLNNLLGEPDHAGFARAEVPETLFFHWITGLTINIAASGGI